jgi:threonine aldolase
LGRQVGPLAAAGLCALRHGPSRLLLDHSHARRVAEALSTVRGVTVDLASVQSNIVMVGTGGKSTSPTSPRPSQHVTSFVEFWYDRQEKLKVMVWGRGEYRTLFLEHTR